MPSSIRTTLLAFTAWFSLDSPAWGQRIYFGVVGGTGVTSDFQGRNTFSPADAYGNAANRFRYLTGPKSFIFGAMVEGRITESLSIEANVLHRPMKRTTIFTEFFDNGITQRFVGDATAVRAWEFPLMLKYTLPPLRVAGD
jgi:hypothetical protein